MNIVTIDPSLTCSAVIINDKKHAFVSEDTAFSKTGKMVKWFDAVDDLITLHTHRFSQKKMTHADKEMSKLAAYEGIANSIMEVVKQELAGSPGDTKVFIEGYSYSSAAGPLIDLVTFGTLVRHTLWTNVSKDVRVITPSELKMYAARFTYPAVTGKKDEVIRNHLGISGGKFKKPDMYRALTENVTLTCPWVERLRLHGTDILAMKSVPKPIEDLNDAKLMFEIAKSNKYF